MRSLHPLLNHSRDDGVVRDGRDANRSGEDDVPAHLLRMRARDKRRGREKYTVPTNQAVSVTRRAVRRAISAHNTTDSIMLPASATPVPAMSSAVP